MLLDRVGNLIVVLAISQLLVLSLLTNDSQTQVSALNKWLSSIVDRFSQDKDLKPAFGVINHCLETDLSGEDGFKANLEKAASYIGMKKPDIARKNKVGSSRLREALSLFTELAKVDNPAFRCTPEMTKILMSNNDAANQAVERVLVTGRLFYFGSMADIRRIDQVIYEAAKRRSEQCQSFYRKQFIRNSEEYSLTDFHRLKDYFDTLLEYKLRNNPVPYLDVDEINIQDLINKKPIRVKTYVDKTRVGSLVKEDINFILDYIKKTGNQSNDKRVAALEDLRLDISPKPHCNGVGCMSGGSLIHSSAPSRERTVIVSMFKDYLVEPCKDYIDQFDETFESALFDNKTKRRPKMSDWTEEEYKFQKYLIYFGLCKKFVNNEQKLIKQFISFTGI